jgi:hypothetical protein
MPPLPAPVMGFVKYKIIKKCGRAKTDQKRLVVLHMKRENQCGDGDYVEARLGVMAEGYFS